MSTAEQRAADEHGGSLGDAPELGLAPDPVEVRRRAGLAAVVATGSSAVAIAYLARATATGAALSHWYWPPACT